MATRLCTQRRKSKRTQLLALYGQHCWLCHNPIAFPSQITLDHIIPLVRGGSNALENLRLAHRSCNNRRGDGDPPVLKLRRDMVVPEWAHRLLEAA